MINLKGLGVIAISTLFLATAGLARAEFPEKPIKIIVMYSPGGSTDVSTRILARHLEPVLGVPVVVQNVPGGGGAVGYQQALDARADGYTLTNYQDSLDVMEATGAVTFTQDDFEPVAIWGTLALTIFAQKDGQYESLGSYVEAAAATPGEVGLAMGFGTPSQFVSKIVEDAMSVDLNLVNVGGGAQKKAAVLGGHVDAGIEPMPGMAEPYKSGQFDILAVLAEERLETFPDIPTAKEQGVEAIHSNTFGLVAPKGTPEDRLQILSDAIGEVVTSEAFLEDNAEINFNVDFTPRVEAKDKMASVRDKMLSVGQSLGF
ncbi:MAG: tripartite tricarboxylate transporter substrate binding protein [Pseudomonadota bacterium]